jgi:uncharacterized protein YjbJ (UPF0337 family)
MVRLKLNGGSTIHGINGATVTLGHDYPLLGAAWKTAIANQCSYCLAARRVARGVTIAVLAHAPMEILPCARDRRTKNTCRRSTIAKEREIMVDKDRVEGAADKAKGAVKEGVGKLTGDQKLQGEGAADKAKGAAKSAVGGIKDTIRDATKR